MTYFVTGATGFIGRFLVQSLLQRGKGTIYVLVRPKSLGKLDELREQAWRDLIELQQRQLTLLQKLEQANAAR